ncbi:MAG: hypothetical protein VX610_05205 [SAR324 cluster bacterium]|nr:hypothetical protein [SAR324 cluster bacterium]
MKESVQISRDEINLAMERFLAKGGTIERIETEVNGLRSDTYEDWLGEDTNSAPEGVDLSHFSITPDFGTLDS